MSDDTLYFKIFSRRSIICYFVVVLLLFSCILRIAVIAMTDYTEVLDSQNCLRLKIYNQRGTVFDCNMVPLTCNSKKIIAAVSPTPKALAAISGVLSREEFKALSEKLKNGKPALCEVPKVIECDGIICCEAYTTDKNGITAVHTVGYTDSDGEGVTGLEKAYNDLLSCKNDAEILYECDGKGRILEGAKPRIKVNSGAKANGVVSTIDITLQSIAEEFSCLIETGAIVIADAKSGKIRASVSMPLFNAARIADYLEASDSPLLNRAVNAYNVGSVFKPCVAIAGINSGKDNFTYTCTGSCEIIDRFFKCHKADGHGLMNLKYGLANSCNTFFYNFAFNIGAEEICKTASTLKFGKSLKLCENFETQKGNIPEIQSLANIANLANLSIGQGELLLSPISILTLYSAIAGDGSYYNPSLVEGTLNDGIFTPYDTGKPTRVMSKQSADKLKDYLVAVLTDGTGSEALSEMVSTAGKTATAQTGKYENGREISASWFCGFFPAQSPNYVVTVFSENSVRQKESCALIFKKIAEKITEKGM